MSHKRRLHPITNTEIDYAHTCATCAHFVKRTVRKQKVVECARAPKVELDDQNRSALPACAEWTRKAGGL